MGWYANLKIGKKLLLGFAAVIFISALIGIAGIKGMGNLDDMLVKLYNTTLISIVYTSEAHTELILHNRRFYRFIATPAKETKEDIEVQIHLNEKNIQTNIDQYRKTHLVPAEEELLARFDKGWPEYTAVTERVHRLTAAGQNKEAVELTEREARPLFHKLEEILAQLVSYNLAEGKQQSEAANKETLDVLNKASGFLRHELSRRIKTRITPRLRFHYDKTNAYGNYMFGLIAEAVKDLPEQGQDDKE